GDIHALGIEQRHLDQVIAGLGGAGDRLATLVLAPAADPHQRVNADLVHAETLFRSCWETGGTLVRRPTGVTASERPDRPYPTRQRSSRSTSSAFGSPRPMKTSFDRRSPGAQARPMSEPMIMCTPW